MIRLLFLEGPRASGKTTVADAFADLGWTRFKTERIETMHPYDAQDAFLDNFMACRDEKFVIDRFHLTELVMTRHTKRLDPEFSRIRAHQIHQRIVEMEGAAIMLILPPLDILLERTLSRPNKTADMPVGDAHITWTNISHEFNTPLFWFHDYAGVDSFAKLVDGRK